MTYAVEYTPDAIKDLKRLPKLDRNRIFNKIQEYALQSSPERHPRQLTGNFNIPIYSLRIGNYRVIHSFDDDKLFIFIIEIGLRKNIYNSY